MYSVSVLTITTSAGKNLNYFPLFKLVFKLYICASRERKHAGNKYLVPGMFNVGFLLVPVFRTPAKQKMYAKVLQ